MLAVNVIVFYGNSVGALVHAPASFIVRIVLANSRFLMTRLRLQASTCKLISAATWPSRRVWKCVYPIQGLSVPNTCPTVRGRIVMASTVSA